MKNGEYAEPSAQYSTLPEWSNKTATSTESFIGKRSAPFFGRISSDQRVSKNRHPGRGESEKSTFDGELFDTMFAKSMSAHETVRESRPERANPSAISFFSSAESFLNLVPK